MTWSGWISPRFARHPEMPSGKSKTDEPLQLYFIHLPSPFSVVITMTPILSFTSRRSLSSIVPRAVGHSRSVLPGRYRVANMSHLATLDVRHWNSTQRSVPPIDQLTMSFLDLSHEPAASVGPHPVRGQGTEEAEL